MREKPTMKQSGWSTYLKGSKELFTVPFGPTYQVDGTKYIESIHSTSLREIVTLSVSLLRWRGCRKISLSIGFIQLRNQPAQHNHIILQTRPGSSSNGFCAEQLVRSQVPSK